MDEHGNSRLKSQLNSRLTKESIIESIQSLTSAKRLWVGFSGGIDSHVLLDLVAHAFSDNPDYQIGAIHVHHGLSQYADDWVKHCEKVCAALQIPLTVLWVDARVTDGNSPEEVAREARFAAWKNFLSEEEVLLLAHHENDQAETILLRLFRGAGPLGLGGMQAKVALGEGYLLRPLLQISKEDIFEYAFSHSLKWIEDDSNTHLRFDRNFLRQEVLPLLVARWPRVLRSVNRAGALCLETATAVQVLAASDLQNVKAETEETLSVSQLLKLEPERRRGVIRLWLQKKGFSFPSRDHMDRIDREVLRAKPGAKPRLKINHYEICRKKDFLTVV